MLYLLLVYKKEVKLLVSSYVDAMIDCYFVTYPFSLSAGMPSV